MVAIHFHCIEKNTIEVNGYVYCLVAHILQNISFVLSFVKRANSCQLNI